MNVDIAVTMVGHIEFFHLFFYSIYKIMKAIRMDKTMNIIKNIMVGTGLVVEEQVRLFQPW